MSYSGQRRFEIKFTDKAESVLLCHFHARQTQIGGCRGRIVEVDDAKECAFCSAIKLTERNGK